MLKKKQKKTSTATLEDYPKIRPSHVAFTNPVYIVFSILSD